MWLLIKKYPLVDVYNFFDTQYLRDSIYAL